MTSTHRLPIALALGFGLASGACQRVNPGFLDTDHGLGGAGEDGGDVTATGSADAGQESTGTSGDGDSRGDETGTDSGTDSASGTAGDGDGADAGDGDGDGGVAECGNVTVALVDDTFFQLGGTEGDPGGAQGVICDTGGGIVDGFCMETNFGHTGHHWVGAEGDLRAYWAVHPSPTSLAAIPSGATITGGTLSVELDFEVEPWANATVVVNAFAAGDASGWTAGSMDAATPAPGTYDSTYKYRVWDVAVWPNWEPMDAVASPSMGDAALGGLVGIQVVDVELDVAVLSDWIADTQSTQWSNGLLISSDAQPYAMSLTALEGSGVLPRLKLYYCTDGA